MKSLEEREAFRQKQRALNAKKESDSGNEQPSDDTSLSSGEEFDAQAYLSNDPKKFSNGLKGLSDEQLAALEKAEGEGKKRANVSSAVSAERKKRDAATSGWNNNG